MAKAYTRGHGFDAADEPSEELAAVITTASARFMGNPKQTSTVTTIGPSTTDVRSHFQGWTLAELFVLNRYRKRAMLRLDRYRAGAGPVDRASAPREDVGHDMERAPRHAHPLHRGDYRDL
jgi:hypothetical protein